jgi:uncharacterized membrane protein YdjX (TVP38/TMEM64 family)
MGCVTVTINRTRRGALLLTLGGMVLCLAMVVAIPDLRDLAQAAFRGDTAAVRERIDDLGWSGVALLFAFMLVHIVVPYPSEIPSAAAGYVYGFWLAVPIAMVGWTISAVGTYYVGRHVGRPTIFRLAGEERATKAERVVDRGGPGALLAARLIPLVPFSLIGYVAGAAHVPLVRFMWTTVVGFLPLTAACAYLGSRLESLHPSDPRLWAALLPLLLALGAGVWAHRRHGPDVE